MGHNKNSSKVLTTVYVDVYTYITYIRVYVISTMVVRMRSIRKEMRGIDRKCKQEFFVITN